MGLDTTDIQFAAVDNVVRRDRMVAVIQMAATGSSAPADTLAEKDDSAVVRSPVVEILGPEWGLDNAD